MYTLKLFFIQYQTLHADLLMPVKKCKGFPYLLLSAGPGADPSAQAVSPRVTVSHPASGRLPLLSATPVVTFPATEYHRLLAGTKLYCLVTKDLNPRAVDRKSNALPIAIPRHLLMPVPYINITLSNFIMIK